MLVCGQDVARRNLSEDVADKEFFQQFVGECRYVDDTATSLPVRSA